MRVALAIWTTPARAAKAAREARAASDLEAAVMASAAASAARTAVPTAAGELQGLARFAQLHGVSGLRSALLGRQDL